MKQLNITQSIGEFEVRRLINNPELLNKYSMQELDEIYKTYIGDYVHCYGDILSAKINLYDNSSEVNSFIFKGSPMWLDKATRVGLMHLVNCSSDKVQVVLENEIITFSKDDAKDFLTQLELYAGQCYLQTQKHLLAVKQLNTAEDFINYDYTTGYPEKIILE